MVTVIFFFMNVHFRILLTSGCFLSSSCSIVEEVGRTFSNYETCCSLSFLNLTAVTDNDYGCFYDIMDHLLGTLFFSRQ